MKLIKAIMSSMKSNKINLLKINILRSLLKKNFINLNNIFKKDNSKTLKL